MIIKVTCYQEILNYQNSEKKYLGKGNDGTAYLLPNNKVIKIMKEDAMSPKIENVITASEIKTSGFLFPTTLYVSNDELVAYETLYVNDLFKEKNNDLINFQELYKAYLEFKKQVEFLSEQGLLLCDLSNNILFDGKKLYAIDTIWYKKNKGYTLEKNLKWLDCGIRDQINNLLFCENIIINDNESIEEFLENGIEKIKTYSKRYNRSNEYEKNSN